jgi:regulator of sigma E protease
MSIESILGAVFVLALVIFVHELGHFLVAKWCDVEVLVFSMGFGPVIFAHKWGETEYRLSAIPFGGYVRMAGEDGAEEPVTSPERGFAAKPMRQRAAIVAAGPGVNVLFAFLIFTATFYFYGESVPVETAKIGAVVPGAPAAEAGVKDGDVIKTVDGIPVTTWEDLALRVRESEGRTLALGIDRDGQGVTLDVAPKPREERDHLGEVIGEAYMIGIERALEPRPVGLFDAVGLGARYTWGFTRLIFETLARLVQGRVSAGDLGGPIMIAQEAGRRAASGLEPLLRFMALISINLGVINVLPVPVLDGGHLAFFLIEAIRGRPLSVRYREIAQQVGVFLLVALMVFVVFNDISRIVSG